MQKFSYFLYCRLGILNVNWVSTVETAFAKYHMLEDRQIRDQNSQLEHQHDHSAATLALESPPHDPATASVRAYCQHDIFYTTRIRHVVYTSIAKPLHNLPVPPRLLVLPTVSWREWYTWNFNSWGMCTSFREIFILIRFKGNPPMTCIKALQDWHIVSLELKDH